LFPEKIGGKYYLFHRRYPDLWISSSQSLEHFPEGQKLHSPHANTWESERVGGGAPPIKTAHGWLVFYHASDKEYIYRLGVMLLDLHDPSKVVAKLDYPILEPTEKYEHDGPIAPAVCFTCGAVEKDGQYLVYYGAGDRCVAVATIECEELLTELLKYQKGH
jgi:predicted GH43/DUF377 family glycosyl hydrolase